MNIFHELAEKAFEGRYLIHTKHGVGEDIRYPGSDELRFWLNIVDDFDAFDLYYLGMDPDEQALALLFIGEMYDNE